MERPFWRESSRTAFGASRKGGSAESSSLWELPQLCRAMLNRELLPKDGLFVPPSH
jgi:hypothetical protein